MTNDIYENFNIKNIQLRNRIVRSATNEHLATLEGMITDSYINLYRRLSESGVGLIITSHMAVSKNQRADLTHVCLNEKKNFERLKLLTSEVHKFSSKIISQISYGGHRAGAIFGSEAWSCSGVLKTKEIAKSDIRKCVCDYVKAIRVAKQVGFDGVQLHLAHGYLLSEFLDPFYNKRTDEYGGVVNNRYRIVHQILSEIKDLILDPDFLIAAKIDSTSKSKDPLFLKDQIMICKLLEKDGIDAIEISGQNFREYKTDTPYFLENALKIKKEVSIPIILVGGFRGQQQMNSALREGIDLISISRPFIAEENFMEKLRNHQMSKCVNCNKCFEIYKTQFKRCILHNEINLQLYDTFS